jgi:serine/threonine protein kinase
MRWDRDGPVIQFGPCSRSLQVKDLSHGRGHRSHGPHDGNLSSHRSDLPRGSSGSRVGAAGPDCGAMQRGPPDGGRSVCAAGSVPGGGERSGLAANGFRQQTAARQRAEAKRVGPYLLDSLAGPRRHGRCVPGAPRRRQQFEQKVAIKLIDLPLATDLFRERFRQERQILAGLKHPFIARLLDGGRYDRRRSLPGHGICGWRAHPSLLRRLRLILLAQRLALFMQVCEAVQFAHQNLVVHRDLKPDNIFVTEDGTPRLLDFGTAKLLSPVLGARPGSEMTRRGIPILHSAVCQPGAGAGQSHHHRFRHLLARRPAVSAPYR